MNMHSILTTISTSTGAGMVLLLAVLGPAESAVAAAGAAKLKNGAVTTPKLKNGAVTPPKLKNGAVTTPKLKNGAVTTSKLKNGAVTTSKLKNGAVTATKLTANLETLSSLSCDEGEVPLVDGGVWACGSVVSSKSFGGYGLSFSNDEDNRNVIVRQRENSDDSVDYAVRVRFEASNFEISIDGVQTSIPFVAMYPSVSVDGSGDVTGISDWIDAPETLNYVRYQTEQSEHDVNTLAKTVTVDTEFFEDTCGSAAGGSNVICISDATLSAGRITSVLLVLPTRGAGAARRLRGQRAQLRRGASGNPQERHLSVAGKGRGDDRQRNGRKHR